MKSIILIVDHRAVISQDCVCCEVGINSCIGLKREYSDKTAFCSIFCDRLEFENGDIDRPLRSKYCLRAKQGIWDGNEWISQELHELRKKYFGLL